MSPPAVAFAAPADVELAPNPINPGWIIEGNPQARAKRLAESADGTSSVMAWSCTPGRFEWHYAVENRAHYFRRGAGHRPERQNPPLGAGRYGLLSRRDP
jgi:uncharacterized cupin superfamily protein